MEKKSKRRQKEQEYFSLEEVAELLKEEKVNIGKYIKNGYLKLGKDLKVHKDDLADLVKHISKKTEETTGISSRLAFVICWASTFLSFLFTLDSSGRNIGRILPTFLTELFLGNILLGVIFFLASFVKPFERFKRERFSRIVPYLAIGYFLFYVAAMTFNGWGFIAGMTTHKTNSQVISFTTPTPINWEQEIRSDINDLRKKNQLNTLTRNDLLTESASKRLQYVLDEDSWRDSPPDGKNYNFFMRQVGYNGEYRGESMAKGYTDPNQLVNALFADETNKKNILNPNFEDIGISVREGVVQGVKSTIVIIHYGKEYAQTTTNTYNNPDPIVDCTSSAPSCNGSSIKLPQSQCSQIICCQIGNTWSVYPSAQKCTEAQKAGQQTPPQQNTQQSPGNNTYCWNNAYGYGYYTSSGDQCNLDNTKAMTYKTCMDTQQLKVNTCDAACKTQLDKDNALCAWAYTGPNPGIELSSDKYGECLNGPDGTAAHYATCLQKCTDQHAIDIKQCTY